MRDMQPSDVPFAELQAYVPVPEHSMVADRQMLVLTFTTPVAGHWERYMPLLVRVLRSLCFSEQEALVSADSIG
ncbi:hypothetical protein [Streptomyces sedi]|uniref:Uncharacterized protein n=1 Tax=Streptomyces sedi TaxID=555059 RepID=A0A5C4VEX3_9ACTN|nr:hypothetical protein [Streptomyces sedi]TNM34381.1 hypothetical protein FH715_01495 [Streptomyces sedi]